MEALWRTRDRAGREVILTKAGREHIQQRHANLADRLGDIRAAIERPDLVTRDVRTAHRENYYRRTQNEPGWIKVVVHYRPVQPQGTWSGEVITAYPVDQPRTKEEPISS